MKKVIVDISIVEGRMMVTFDYLIRVNRKNELHYCYVPGFDTHFEARSKEEALAKADGLIEAIYREHITDRVKFEKHTLLKELHQLGFRAPQNDLILTKIYNGRLRPEVTMSFNVDRDEHYEYHQGERKLEASV